MIEISHFKNLLNDFSHFINYFKQKPSWQLSGTEAKLKFSDLFELNKGMFFSAPGVTNKSPQKKYPLLNLFYYLAIETKISKITKSPGCNKFILNNERFSEYNSLNEYEKYFSLLACAWKFCDWNHLNVYNLSRGGNSFAVSLFIEQIFSDKRGEIEIENEDGMRWKLIMLGSNFENLNFLGLYQILWDNSQKRDNYNIPVKSILINNTHREILQRLAQKRNLNSWNVPAQREAGTDFLNEVALLQTKNKSKPREAKSELYSEPFPSAFLDILPKDCISKTLSYDNKQISNVVFVFKVLLNKKLYRTIAISSENTLDDLHNAIINSFGFDDDHLYSFYVDGELYSDNCYNSPNGDDPPFANEIELRNLGIEEGVKMLYLYDFGDHWEFSVFLEKIDAEKNFNSLPKIVEKKGTSPKQYSF